MRWFCAKKKPILGICRGMQVVDVFFGGTLFRHLGTAHVHDNTLHTIITAESGRLRPLLGEKLAVNSYHHQAIRTLGAGLHGDGRSAMPTAVMRPSSTIRCRLWQCSGIRNA